MAIAVADTNKNADRVQPVGVWYSRFEPWSSLTIFRLHINVLAAQRQERPVA